MSLPGASDPFRVGGDFGVSRAADVSFRLGGSLKKLADAAVQSSYLLEIA